jgi:ElaB/YqjD/DUF883 family membrane-anchored ribosome-binding protein
VDQRTRIRHEIDETTDSIVEKIEMIDQRVHDLKDDAQDRIRDFKHDAREAVSLEHHVQERPLPMFGVAVALGFAIDRLFL